MDKDKKPVLLIAFNRPKETEQVLRSIEDYNPDKLYVTLDGPRIQMPSDIELTSRVQDVLDSSSLRSRMVINKSDTNLGCQRAVVSGLNWFFENETSGIILEDDIIPHKAFYEFQNLMLSLYEHNRSIKAVLGFNNHGQGVESNNHFLYEGFYPWGWGTWRDRWNQYENVFNDTVELKKIIQIEESKKRYLYQSLLLNLTLINQNHLDTWDYQFFWLITKQKGLCVAPYANLTKNIGINGAHSANNYLNFQYGKCDSALLVKEERFVADVQMNDLLYKEHYNNRYTVRLKLILLWVGAYRHVKLVVKNFKKLKILKQV